MAVRLSALRTGRALLSRNIFGTLFCERVSKPQGLVRLEGLGELEKKSIDLIGSRTCDLPASIVVSPTFAEAEILNQFRNFMDKDFIKH
jgi:hypothetical protein